MQLTQQASKVHPITSKSEHLPSHDMLGMRLDDLDLASVLERIVEMADAGQPGYCCLTNVHQCVLVHDDPKFGAKVNAATFVISDSVILERARATRYGLSYKSTQRGADIMHRLCAQAAARGIKIALIGGKNNRTLEKLKINLTTIHPKLEIACALSPPFRQLSADEDANIINAISNSGARLIFVGLGCPKQENWMADHTQQIGAMMIGVGAAFDFNAGVIEPSPQWVHAAGLEWLYRLLREPRRLGKRYLTTSPRFLWLLALDIIRNGSKSS
ncbi:WecB/TagA/CpsF family glycosyltransferase [Maritalea porphyrae]|uniref:WecB/TagA/CpsF family glycosyltransferase n=1 Tax=Maritalea porphyrae TaxID=880732 RepID=UPI0022AFB992|nr:WecB/TagA/CpsF family glycosyltransferase [Maritalea porphyrae]MCZ4271835.1 WecB/TagA/CpsF family glycosyltransferase [Maritalea porphyrae]